MTGLAHNNDHIYSDDSPLPDTPYEYKICAFTLICSLLFVSSGIYYFFAPDSRFILPLLTATGGMFLLALLNFFWAAFSGKLCGCKNGRQPDG